VKFVIGDRHDYDIAKKLTTQILPAYGCSARYAFSPLMGSGGLEPQILLKWMQQDKLFGVIFNTQIHKLLKLYEEDYS
jgi:hypothetical protein